ncbi:MAG: DUF2846 domain-containing protein [Formivibrio sp.]|nr:DUF2846 domain-containing protein [Formivibrio sp.]
MFRKFVCIAILAVSLVGCASVPMGDAKKDAELKQFSKKADVAGVYIYRNEVIGTAVRMDVEIDGNALGKTAAKTYFYTEVTPGTHTITSKSENTDSLNFDAAAGQLYYIWQEVKMGVLFARTKLHLVGENEGRKGVLETKLAATLGTTQTPATSKVSAPKSVPNQVSARGAVLAQPGFIATGFASILDVDAIPYINDRARDAYREWLAQSTPKAFAIASNSHYASTWGLKPRDTTLPSDPSERALLICERIAKQPCKLYAVNGSVVWPKAVTSAKVNSSESLVTTPE